MQHRQPLPSSTVSSALARSKRIVDAGRAEFVDHNRGAMALRAVEEVLHQRGLAGAEKTGDHDDRNARAALMAQPAAEGAGRSGTEESVQPSVRSFPRKRESSLVLIALDPCLRGDERLMAQRAN